MQNNLYVVPTEHIAMPNFGKMHNNPFIACRRSLKVHIAIKILNAKWPNFGDFEPPLNINIFKIIFAQVIFFGNWTIWKGQSKNFPKSMKYASNAP